MHWVLQNNVYDEQGFETLLETLRRFGIPHSLHKVVPFVGDIIPDINPTGKVICMGSYSFRHLAKSRGWNPGVWDIAEQTFLVQKENWGRTMLNYDSIVVEFEKARFPFYYDEMFVRPIDDTKAFSGKLFSTEEFDEWRDRVCVLKLDDGSDLNNKTLVQLAPYKKIYTEYRFWIAKGQIITSSLYKTGTRVHYVNGAPEYVEWFVKERIAEWEPHEAYVLDVADTPDGMRVVEINTLNSSGYYAADMQKLVMSLEEMFG